MSFADKKLVFGGAGPGTPWGTLGVITGQALEPHGYEVRVERNASRGRCPGMVQNGDLEFGATQGITTSWAYEATHNYAAGGPMPRLRVIANIMHPAWLGVAARWETGITSLAEVAEKKMPVRVLGGGGEMFGAVFAHYGLSRELIESWGGRFLPTVMVSSAGGGPYGTAPWVRSGEFDLIMDNFYAAYTPEFAAFHEASVLFNLRFLPLPHDLIRKICAELGGEPGLIPYRLARGVEAPTPSVYRPSQVIFGRDDMPEDFAYLLAKSLDDRRDLFRKVDIP